MNIDIEVARKVLEAVDAGLVNGLGKPEPGKMCVEAAVNYALGLPHGDEPACVAPSLRTLKIQLNDSQWSSPQARAAGLRRLALIQLGSAGHLDEQEFAKRCARLAIHSCVPAALRATARLFKGDAKDSLLNAADLCEREPTLERAREARDTANAAKAAANAANAANAAKAAYAAAYAANAAKAAYATAYATAYAAYAAYAAAYAAYAANAAYAAYAANAAADSVLAEFAEGVVQILVEMNVPGVRWLSLTEVRPYFAR